jgi:hypothetical protein
LLEEFALLLAGLLQDCKLAIKFLAMEIEFGLTLQSEMQFRRSSPRRKGVQLLGAKFAVTLFRSLDQVPHPGHALMGSAQAKFLLALQALAKVQHRLQRKMKGHWI